MKEENFKFLLLELWELEKRKIISNWIERIAGKKKKKKKKKNLVATVWSVSTCVNVIFQLLLTKLRIFLMRAELGIETTKRLLGNDVFPSK